MYMHMYRVRTDSWILEKVLKITKQFLSPWKSLEKWWKVWSFHLQINCLKCLASELFFLRSILPIAKTFSHRMIMRSLRTLLCPHYSMVTASLQCIMWKASLLISYLMTLQSLEKEISVFFFLNLEKVSNLYIPWCTKSSYKGAVISHPKELYYLPIVHSEWLSPLWRFSYHEWLLHDKMWARVA